MSQFSLSFEKYKNKTAKQIDKAIRNVALGLTRDIIMDTPVDQSRLRNAWLVSIDKEDSSKPDIIDESGQTAINKASQALNNPIGKYIYIQNNLDYAVKIEYGGSPKKAPQGMLRINLLRYKKFLKDNTR